MKKLFIALGIGIAIYAIWKIYSAFKAGNDAAAAVSHGVTETVKAPVNTMSSILAFGALGFDIISGKGIDQSLAVYGETTGNIWK